MMSDVPTQENPLTRLAQRGLTLPSAPAPAGLYQPYTQEGSLVMISGMLPLREGRLSFLGPVGEGRTTIEEARQAAVDCLLNALAVLQESAGEDFSGLRKILFLQGFVYGVEGFSDSPLVLNAASEILNDIFGSRGAHARAAVSVNGLPKAAAVELTLTAAVTTPNNP